MAGAAPPPLPAPFPVPLGAAPQAALAELDIFNRLAPYRPVLVGTFPLGLAMAGSDLDIICQAADLEAFAARVAALYGHKQGFRVAVKPVVGEPSAVAAFAAGGVPVEVFAQRLPVERQRGYRHLVVEARLLALGGAAAHDGIRALRAGGLKTEPAFARYFGLTGDPYAALLDLYDADDATLAQAACR